MNIDQALDKLSAAFPQAQIAVSCERVHYGLTDNRRETEWNVWVGSFHGDYRRRLFDGPSLDVCVAQALMQGAAGKRVIGRTAEELHDEADQSEVLSVEDQAAEHEAQKADQAFDDHQSREMGC